MEVVTIQELEVVEIRNSIKSARKLSTIFVEVGLVSPSKLSVVGLDGYLFLYRGSNDVMRLYEAERSSSYEVFADRWDILVRNRLLYCEQKGAQFLQVIIPEKSSIIPEMFPFDVPIPTALLSWFNSKLHDLATCEPANILSALDHLKDHPDRLSIFGKTDSHCTVKGSNVLFQKIIDTLFGKSASCTLPFGADDFYTAHGKVISGSLAKDFFGTPLYEVVPDLSIEFKQSLSDPKVVRRVIPDGGGYLGNTVVFKNDKAPISKKVVVFGNSFFERGAAPEGLSWWFSRAFEEFHFVWSIDMDMSYIEEYSPDIVICQTIERFLHVVPKC